MPFLGRSDIRSAPNSAVRAALSPPSPLIFLRRSSAVNTLYCCMFQYIVPYMTSMIFDVTTIPRGCSFSCLLPSFFHLSSCLAFVSMSLCRLVFFFFLCLLPCVFLFCTLPLSHVFLYIFSRLGRFVSCIPCLALFRLLLRPLLTFPTSAPPRPGIPPRPRLEQISGRLGASAAPPP